MKKFIITKSEYETIRQHSYNLYSAIEEMQDDFSVLYKILEKIEKRVNKDKNNFKLPNSRHPELDSGSNQME